MPTKSTLSEHSQLEVRVATVIAGNTVRCTGQGEVSHEALALWPDACTPFFRGDREAAKGGLRVGGVVSILTALRVWGKQAKNMAGWSHWLGGKGVPPPGEKAQKTRDASAQGLILSFIGSHFRHGRGCQGTVTRGPSLHQVDSCLPCGS